jgi:hypothetical protein
MYGSDCEPLGNPANGVTESRLGPNPQVTLRYPSGCCSAAQLDFHDAAK